MVKHPACLSIYYSVTPPNWHKSEVNRINSFVANLEITGTKNRVNFVDGILISCVLTWEGGCQLHVVITSVRGENEISPRNNSEAYINQKNPKK